MLEKAIEEKIRSLFFSVVVEQVKSNLIASLPFLGYPVIGWFFGFFVNYLAGKLWDEMSVHGMFVQVDFKQTEKLRNYQNAEYQLRRVLKTTVPEEQKEKAINEYRNKLRNLIRINVS
jgi:hypothetical protein